MDCSELFERVSLVIAGNGITPAVCNKIMHETLVLTCAQGLKNSKYGFGDLNAQVETLIKQLHIPTDEANAIRQMRHHSNRTRELSPEDRLYDAKALSDFIGRVFNTPLPDDLTAVLPRNRKTKEETIHTNAPDKRCIVVAWDTTTITVIVDEDGAESTKTVYYTRESQYAHMDYLYDILREGMHLNLLGCEEDGNTITPRLIVVEPDCLLDISVIASCFEDYGHHPLLYVVNRMKEKPNSQAILLGNFAGSALDDIINSPQANIRQTLIRNFKEKALEYSTCPNFNASKFKQDAVTQASNIKQAIAELHKDFDLSKAILEPSFICEKLGIQGRVDLMTTDLKLLVEQKSGKNIFLERNSKNIHGAQTVEKHYVQLLLYFGVLYYNFEKSKPDIRLLYSKYPLPGGLMSVANLMKLVYEAIRFRNEAVAQEFDIAHNGFAHILPKLTTENLNTADVHSFFYDTYLRPQLDATLLPLQHLRPLERSYFCRMMQFAIRENLMSKVGVVEGHGNSVANLWNMPLTEKKETGNIYTGLTIIKKEKSPTLNGNNNSYDLITLDVPMQGVDFLPNFRRGDMVCLYAYPETEEPDIRKAMVFRGALADIRSNRLSVKLNNGQQNPDIFDRLPYSTILSSTAANARPDQHFLWCIEHGSSDVGGTAAIHSLYEFVTSTDDRKALLLGQRAPRRNKDLPLSRSYDPRLDPILLKAKQAQDYFLLVGPPGTGKTSRALRFMVQESLASQDSVLLLSYTNRAVDEICSMLVEAGIGFIRIGNELSCAPPFVPYLLSNVVGENPKLDDMRQLLLDTRVVVGTTSMLQSRPFIFSLKHFSVAIVDESSQILEPDIIGLLASHRGTASGQQRPVCNIDKFILIGDYKQLPAVVQQNDIDATVSEPELQAIGLHDCKSSLFERLIGLEHRSGRTDFIGTLQHQGRMHPDIAAFPNREFYFDEHLLPVPLRHQLATTIDYNGTSEDAIDDLLKQQRLLFIASQDCRRPDISDKVNVDEARIVADLLRRIHRFTSTFFDPDKTVGVIVPYRNQIAMMRQEIEKLDIPDLDHISIDTVERYQGSQRDIIIYSFTVQQRYQLDFLTANVLEEKGHLIDRKLNVALTRARKQLILTGNPEVLAHSPIFKKLIDYAKEKKGYLSSYQAEKA
ncbi:MAG: AAA domain-containing protein [Prevotella sp.]|jgi:DNA replication ATP-dependent helicase Dna2